MAKLILSMDGLVLREIPLTKERTTIGRKPHNDIQIDNLAVSGEHAVVVTILNDSFLEDLGSTNGTLVNGNPIKKHFLQNNDIIELGKYKLKFVSEAVSAAAGAEKADFEKTMVLRPSAMRAAMEQSRPAPGPASATQPQAAAAVRVAAVQQALATAQATASAERPVPGAAPAQAPAAPRPAQAAPRPAQPLGAIQLLSGANAGRELELSKPLTTLGRPGVQVAVLTRRPQGYFITHVEGSNHPAVNGAAIGAAPHALKDHDVIELAGVKIEFFLKG
jgi:pSer/pThr/pTyr-binding forkhead associated (FHA) protein